LELIPQEIREQIHSLYEAEENLDPVCHVKIFTPGANWTWYVIELNKNDLNTCFGYVVGNENELGYFTLDELESINGPLGLSVERDLSFKPTPFSEIKEIT
jgi:hypothetical protein